MPDASKNSKNSPDDVEDDDDVGEEEYEIQRIVEAQKGYFDSKRWAFKVKWKGYPDEENSWVDEPDFFAKDMIQAYWKANPDIPGNPIKAKTARTSVGAKASTGRSRKSATEATQSEDDSPKERRKSRKASEEPTMDTEEDEPEPPKKKAKTAGTRKSLSAIAKAANGDTASEAEGGDAFVGHTIDAMDPYVSKKSWEDLIDRIETVEQADDGTLMVYYTATNGVKALSPSQVLAQKAPQKLIKFYEDHLRWKSQPVTS